MQINSWMDGWIAAKMRKDGWEGRTDGWMTGDRKQEARRLRSAVYCPGHSITESAANILNQRNLFRWRRPWYTPDTVFGTSEVAQSKVIDIGRRSTNPARQNVTMTMTVTTTVTMTIASRHEFVRLSQLHSSEDHFPASILPPWTVSPSLQLPNNRNSLPLLKVNLPISSRNVPQPTVETGASFHGIIYRVHTLGQWTRGGGRTTCCDSQGRNLCLSMQKMESMPGQRASLTQTDR